MFQYTLQAQSILNRSYNEILIIYQNKRNKHFTDLHTLKTRRHRILPIATLFNASTYILVDANSSGWNAVNEKKSKTLVSNRIEIILFQYHVVVSSKQLLHDVVCCDLTPWNALCSHLWSLINIRSLFFPIVIISIFWFYLCCANFAISKKMQ